jgi:hypothetical protein
MGILDDLAMGFGLKEKDRDYYDRTEQTMRRTQGDARADQYNKYLGRTESGFEPNSRYGNAPNYSTAIGPSVSDFRQAANPGRDPYTSGGQLRSDFQPGSLAQTYRDANLPQPGTFMHKLTNLPTPMGVLARIISGYDAPPPQGELRSSYRPQRKQAPIIEPVAPITTPVAGGSVPMDMEAAYSASPSLLEPDVQFEVFTPSNKAAADAGLEVGQPSDPRYMPGGEFDAFMEQVGSLPVFDKYRDDPVRMRAIFEEYLKTQGGSN